MFLFDMAISTPTPISSPVPVYDTPVSELWKFLPLGYIVTILIETPILLIGLPSAVSIKQRLLCGVWLTACTYPIVVLVMPMLFEDWARWQYLLLAEIFAPVAECTLFWLAFRGRLAMSRSDWATAFLAIVVANLASFGMGEILNYYSWFGLL